MELLIEDATPELSEYLTDFCTHVCTELGLPNHPDMSFVDKTNNTSFGSYRPADGSIIVATGGRHVADILRTLAHEIVHDVQHLNGEPDLPLDELEYEANAMAGMLMRDWNKLHPELYGVEAEVADHASEGESQGAVFADPTRPSGPINMGEAAIKESDSDALKLLKLQNMALRAFPSSPRQQEIQKQIEMLRKKMKGQGTPEYHTMLNPAPKIRRDDPVVRHAWTHDNPLGLDWNQFVAQYTKKNLKEDGIVNSAGSGAIAGLGVGPQGEPGVHPKKKKFPILQPMTRRKTFATLREEFKDPAVEARKKLATQKIPVDAKTLLARRKLVAQIDAKKKGNLP